MNEAMITLHEFGVAYENKPVLENVNTAHPKLPFLQHFLEKKAVLATAVS